MRWLAVGKNDLPFTGRTRVILINPALNCARQHEQLVRVACELLATMDTGYIPAITALAGAALGGATSFASSWTTLRAQMRAEHEATSRSKREELYKRFIEEASN